MTFAFNDDEIDTIKNATYIPDELRKRLIENYNEITETLDKMFTVHNNIIRQYNANVDGYRERLLAIVREKRALYGDRITKGADSKLAILGRFAVGLELFEEVELELEKDDLVPPFQNPFNL